MRPMFIRARMVDSGHEFDTTADSIWIRRGLAVRVKPKMYPPSPDPRPAKPRVRLSDLTATSAVDPNQKEGEPNG